MFDLIFKSSGASLKQTNKQRTNAKRLKTTSSQELFSLVSKSF